MLKEVGLLLKLKFSNILGLRKLKRTTKEKVSFICICVAVALLFAVLGFYVGGMSYLFCLAGLELLVPALLCLVTSLVIFFLTVVKSGSDLFDLRSYEMLAPFPLKRSSIIASKLLGTYIIDALISLFVFISGTIGVVIFTAPTVDFYFMMVLGALVTPVVPICLACFIGAGIYALTSRLKNAKLIASILVMALTIAIVVLTSATPEEMSEEALLNLIQTLSMSIAGIYPPAMWLAKGVWGIDYLYFALYLLISVIICVVFVVIFTKVYKRVCTALASVYNKKVKLDLSKSKINSPIVSLYKKEIKKLFSSVIYMTNTLTGNIMAVVVCIVLAFSGGSIAMGGLEKYMGVVIASMIGAVICMMPITACSISIEGKNWDLLKSLPIEPSKIFGAKILLNLTFALPSALLCSVVLALTQICTGVPVWYLFVMPVVFVIFMSVTSVAINIKAPTFNWSTETQVVKQSKSTFICMIVDLVSGLLCAVVCIFAEVIGMILIPIALLALCAIIFNYIKKIDVKYIV